MAVFKVPLDPLAAKRAGVTDPPFMMIDITCNVPETAVDAELIKTIGNHYNATF